jgi:hypothetical protein
VFVCEVSELPVVNDLDLGLVGAARDALDEAGTVGRDVDAGGVVDLLDHRMSFLTPTSRSPLPLPHTLRHSASLYLVLVDGIFSLRVVLEVDSFQRAFGIRIMIGRAFLLLLIGNVDGCSGE